MATSGNNTIDIAATFQALYGYVPAEIPAMPAAPQSANPYSTGKTLANYTRTPIGGLTQLYAQTPTLSDMLGRKVFMPITIITQNLSAQGKPVISYDFPFSMLSLKNKKIIKETPMVARGGSVVEEIALGGWEIEMKGFLIDADGQFPDDQLVALNTLYSTNLTSTTNYSVQLKCAISDIVLGGNCNVVITEVEIPAKSKVIGVRDFSFKMIQAGILDLYNVTSQQPAASTSSTGS